VLSETVSPTATMPDTSNQLPPLPRLTLSGESVPSRHRDQPLPRPH